MSPKCNCYKHKREPQHVSFSSFLFYLNSYSLLQNQLSHPQNKTKKLIPLTLIYLQNKLIVRIKSKTQPNYHIVIDSYIGFTLQVPKLRLLFQQRVITLHSKVDIRLKKEETELTWKRVGAGPSFGGPKAPGPRKPRRYYYCCYHWFRFGHRLGHPSPAGESGGSGLGEERVRTTLPLRSFASASNTTSLPYCSEVWKSEIRSWR